MQTRLCNFVHRSANQNDKLCLFAVGQHSRFILILNNNDHTHNIERKEIVKTIMEINKSLDCEWMHEM